MKKNLLIVILLIGYVTAVMSCSSNDDDNSDDDQDIDVNQTTQIAQDGDWRVTTFIDSGDDETGDFSGYTFTFNADGSVVATNGSNTVNGTWFISNDSSSDDDDDGSSSGPDFNISFAVGDDDPFEDLNDDWDIISVTNTQIELIDVSGGNGGTDYLTFEKL